MRKGLALWSRYKQSSQISLDNSIASLFHTANLCGSFKSRVAVFVLIPNYICNKRFNRPAFCSHETEKQDSTRAETFLSCIYHCQILISGSPGEERETRNSNPNASCMADAKLRLSLHSRGIIVNRMQTIQRFEANS